MLLFLETLREALDDYIHSEIRVFYADFSKAFWETPSFNIFQKCSHVGVVGSKLDVLLDCLKSWTENVCVELVSSKTLKAS